MQEILITLRTTIDEWTRTRWSDLQFAEGRTALLVFVVLLAAALMALVARVVAAPRAWRPRVALPALLPVMRGSPFAAVRHLPQILFALGLPFFAIALADPLTGFTREEVSYPGRRIALLVDASTSMVMQFNSSRLQTQGTATFFTATAAVEHFIKRRMNGPYRDLLALVQFGNQAYVVTPFTTDYENILLSVRLVSDPREWGRFSDWGTTIVEGMEQGLRLFESFEFANASGNLMIVFTDGRDSDLQRQGRPLDQLVAEARGYGIPVYMVRTAFKMGLGEVIQDKIWKSTVERTGGRFYAASDEDSLLAALAEIDRLSPGRIDVREYSVQRPRFAGYALLAAALWLSAALLKFGVRGFRTFP